MLLLLRLLVHKQVLETAEDMLALVLHDLAPLLGLPGLFFFDLDRLRISMGCGLELLGAEQAVEVVVVVVGTLLGLYLSLALLHVAEFGHAVRVAAVENAEWASANAVAVKVGVGAVGRAV